MTHVVAQPCFGCKYTDCVVVCPVECFYEGEQMLYIHPDECIDCEACVPECPVEAIFHEDNVPEEWAALRTGLRYLEAARPPVPYCLLQGDHDLGYEYTGEYPFMFRKAAHRRSQVDGGVASAVTAQPHWRGAFASTHQASASWASSWANSWYELITNSSLAPMLVICLECRRRHSNWSNLGPPPSQIPCSLLRCQTGHATRCFGGRQACWGATQGTMPSS